MTDEGENSGSSPSFFISDPFLKNASSQTPIDSFSDISSLNPTNNFDVPPEINGSGPILLRQYSENIEYYISHTPENSLSPCRQEILSKVKQYAIFQSKIFNKSNLPDGSLPANTFENLSVSLYLVIYSDHFTFSTASPGIEISGDLCDDSTRVLSYVSQCMLPPRFLETLRKMNLVWYDGGLVCEITDQRKAYSKPLRVLMKVNPIDITNYGFEIEQEYLFNRFPLLCLEPDIQVSKLARAVVADSQRWQPLALNDVTPAEFLQMEYPTIFIEPLEPKKPRVRPQSTHTEEELRKMLMEKLGITQNPEPPKTQDPKPAQQENSSLSTPNVTPSESNSSNVPAPMQSQVIPIPIPANTNSSSTQNHEPANTTIPTNTPKSTDAPTVTNENTNSVSPPTSTATPAPTSGSQTEQTSNSVPSTEPPKS